MSKTQKTSPIARRNILLAAAALGVGVTFNQAGAATRTWNGSADNAFGNAANWDTGVPVAADDAVFAAPATTNVNPTLGAAQTVQSLTFNASPNITVTANGGSAFRLTVGGRTGDDVVVLGGNHIITQSDVGSTFVGFIHSNNFNFNIASGASLEIAARINQAASSNIVSMNGGGTLILSQNNGGTGGWNITTNGFTINGGTLIIRNSNAPGNSGNKWFVNSGGTLQLESNWLASTNANGNIALNDGATLRSNGGSRTIGTGTGSMVLSGTSTINTLSNLTVNQDFSGAGGFNKTGAATFTMGGANTYTGNTNIAEGTLTLAAAADISTSKIVNVQSGATLNATAAGFSVAANQTLGGAGAVSGTVTTLANSTLAPGLAATAGTLTLNNDLNLNGGTLQVDLANVTTLGGGVNDLLSVTGSFNANNPTTLSINKLNNALTAGTYTLATFAGAFGGSFSNLQLPTAVTRQTLTLIDPAGNPGKIDLLVSGSAADLNWKGNGSTNAWKTNGANVWLNGASADKFFDWDTVTFTDDLGSNSPTLDIQGTVSPAAITVNNSAVNYTFGGSGKFSDVGTLTKSGTGSLTIANTGGNQALAAVVNAGTLVLNGGNTFGTMTINNSGTVTLANATPNNIGALNILPGGTLNIGDGVTSGVGDAGATLNNNQGTVVYNHPDDWTSNTIIGGSGTVKKQGAGIVTVNSSNTYTGPTFITAGTILATGNASLGALPGGAVTITGTGSLDVGGFAAADVANFGQKQFNISGTGPSASVGVLTNSSSANRQINAFQKVTLTADATVGGPGRFDVRAPSGSLAGTAVLDLAGFTLTKVGTGAFGLVRADATPGNIHVTAGNLNIEQSSNVTGAGTITIEAGATGQFNALTGTVSRNMVINGGTLTDVTQTTNTMVGSPIVLGATSTLNSNSPAGFTLTGVISGVAGAGITKTGSGVVSLAVNNTYSGSTTINNGTLAVGSSSNLGDASATNGIVFGGGTLLTTGPIASSGRSLTLNGAGTVDTNSFDSQFGNVDGTGSFTKNSAGVLTVNHVVSGNLTVNSGTLKMAADSGANGVSHVAALNIVAPAKLDLAANKLITTSAAGTWNGASYDGVTGLVASGKGTGNLWDGSTGIITTQTGAVGSNLNSIGVAKASDAIPATATATVLWAGQTVTGTDTLVMYTYGGDANLDGKINVDDYIKIDSGIASGITGWSNGDFNYDGKVNIDDYTTVIDANIGNQNGTFFTAGGVGGGGPSGVSAVPEPVGGVMVLGAALGLLRRRRRMEGQR